MNSLSSNNYDCNCSYKYDDCCCKTGIICALNYIRDLLISSCGNNIPYITNLLLSGRGYSNIPALSINNITTDILAINTTTVSPISNRFLSLCSFYYASFDFNEGISECNLNPPFNIEEDIKTRFDKICYSCTSKCCCKNGIIDTLIKTRNSLDDGSIESATIVFDNGYEIPNIIQIIAINNDIVWVKDINGLYYVASICEISSIEYEYPTNV